jgi:hypothetical protein
MIPPPAEVVASPVLESQRDPLRILERRILEICAFHRDIFV